MDVSSITGFLSNYKYPLAFYLLIIIWIIVKRKNFDFPGKILAMYRTKIGISWMQRQAEKRRELIKLLGYIGIGIGYVGMVFITFFIIKGIWDFFFVPTAPPPVQPLIPGVKLPGSTFFIPFWEAIISIFIVAVVHEFSHGLVAKAHGLKVKNTGIFFLGPIIGAFVEPDEKKVEKKPDIVQYSIFAAGPFSNILLAGVALLLVLFVFGPALGAMADTTGVMFETVDQDYPAYKAGVKTQTPYDTINGEKFSNILEFQELMQDINPGDELTISNNELSHKIIAAQHPQQQDKGYIGVTITNAVEIKGNKTYMTPIYTASAWLLKLFMYLYLISLGIGLVNLLPLGPVDGGRMFKLSMEKIAGKNKGNKIWAKISIALLIILIFLLVVPMIKSILGI